VKDEEALESSALISELPDSIKHEVHQLLADCVVTTCIVVCCIFLPCDKLLWVKQLTVSSCAYLVCNSAID
jgi:hypothetical protein